MATTAQPSQASLPTMVPISIKLDDENFLTWKMQAMGTIKAHKLGKFLSERQSGGMPRRYANDENRILDKVTEEFETWEQQDQFVFTWLLASMTTSLHTRMAGL